MNKQEAIKKLQDVEQEMAKLKAIIEAPDVSYKRERVADGEKFWLITLIGDISWDFDWKETSSAAKCFAIGNYYYSQQEAEQARDKQLALQRIKDAIREANAGWVPDWNNRHRNKYLMQYGHETSTVEWYAWVFTQTSTADIYCSKEAKEKLGDSLFEDFKIYLGVE